MKAMRNAALAMNPLISRLPACRVGKPCGVQHIPQGIVKYIPECLVFAGVVIAKTIWYFIVHPANNRG